jgi:hypothetical protein
MLRRSNLALFAFNIAPASAKSFRFANFFALLRLRETNLSQHTKRWAVVRRRKQRHRRKQREKLNMSL